MKERRKHHRIVVNKRAWICDFDENPSPITSKDCLIVDISEGGACIQCSALYEENQPIAFTYQDFMEEGFRPVAGVVMWSKRYSEQDYRYGIKFLGLNTQMLRRIQDIVVQAAEGAGPPEKTRGKQNHSRRSCDMNHAWKPGVPGWLVVPCGRRLGQSHSKYLRKILPQLFPAVRLGHQR